MRVVYCFWLSWPSRATGLAQLQARVRGLKVLTGPLCQGTWVNIAADWDLAQSHAE